MKNKLILFIVLIIVVISAGYFIFIKPRVSVPLEIVADARNASFTVENIPVTLINGKSEQPIADSVEKIVTQYFGNETRGDFNADGKEDVAFILTQSSGGTGTFYYVAALISSGNSYVGTNAILLGDRIAPQTTEFSNNKIIVNYADRKPDEPMSTQPSFGVSKYLKVDGNTLSEVNN